MTLNEFKNSLVIGDSYQTTHEFTGDNPSAPKDLGVRKLGYKDTVKFGFESTRNAGEFSYRDWPKKSELTVIENGFILENDFCKLTYVKVS